MPCDYEELLLRLATSCCPNHTLSPVADAAPLQFQGWEHSHTARHLFTPKIPLWTARCHEYVCAFHVDELNFDTLAQCHTAALETGTAQFNPAAKHSLTRITAIILCNTAQADAMEALVRFQQRSGCPLSFSAKLDYRLVAVNRSCDEVVYNRRARKLKAPLQAQLSAC